MTENTQKTEAPTPVQDWENRDVKGEALACKKVYDEHVAKVAKLREQQEAYVGSLPKDPLEALADIRRTLSDMGDISESQYAPRAALEIIYNLALYGALDDSDEIKNALFWLARKGLSGLDKIEEETRRASEISHQFHPRRQAYRA